MKIAIILALLFISGIVNAQKFNDPLNIIKGCDFQKYERQKNKLLKKMKWFNDDSSNISIISFVVGFKEKDEEMFTKEEFLDKSFIKDLTPFYYCFSKKCKSKDSIIGFSSIIYDSTGVPLVYMNEFQVSDIRNLKENNNFKSTFEEFEKFKLAFKFFVNGTNGFIEFGVTKNGEILVFNKRNSIREDYPLEKGVYPFDYFISNYWGKLFPSEKPY